jgi:hypothetical protein
MAEEALCSGHDKQKPPLSCESGGLKRAKPQALTTAFSVSAKPGAKPRAAAEPGATVV